MKKFYDFTISLEENLAFEIYQHIVRFDDERKGFVSLDLDKQCLNYLGFEISNAWKDKHVLISYVIRAGVTNVKLVEFYLMTLGINIEFINTANSNSKQYLIVFSKLKQ